MKIYKGVDAIAPFQQKKLLKKLRKIDPNITSVSAEFYHFVEVKKALNDISQKQLAALLSYGSPFSSERTKNILLVIPRPGTISPWSSKATDIIRNSGIKEVSGVERGVAYYITAKSKIRPEKFTDILHDRMTQTVINDPQKASALFRKSKPVSFQQIDLKHNGKERLRKTNHNLGLALEEDEIDYLIGAYSQLGRNPSDTELMMFGSVNSEHCRHKIFNADWIVDEVAQPKSLFKMIKNTYEKSGDGVLSAYSDNAAVLSGNKTNRFFSDSKTKQYKNNFGDSDLVIKAETHNHPTAIAPFPGSATGAGGEIRDEGATGRGAKPKMGLTGFTVSNLNIPGFKQPWESRYGKPDRISSSLDIMIDAPLGGAAFNNEFGRPNLAGYFRTFEQKYDNKRWGYHKPIMIAGGLGTISRDQIKKNKLPVDALIIILGGPSMLIGLGGGAASSMQTGESEEDLDFASVQRGNAEVQRRAQEVINNCWTMKRNNPIISIHDVGAGGLSNALPELVHDSGLGGKFELRDIPNDEPGMSPMGIWSNESQERYVLGISSDSLAIFKQICERERCPFAVVGRSTLKEYLVVTDRVFKNRPVDIPMDLLFGKPPKMLRKYTTKAARKYPMGRLRIDLDEAFDRVLRLPSVASKKFLITIGDRSVGGLTARDQMVGPWQVPVSDVAVTAASFDDHHGEAMSMGERSPLALLNSSASGRMAVGEALTNIAAAQIEKISDVKLSANWMAAAGEGMEDQNLFETVKALGESFCPELGITIPVGKDSLSMKTIWEEGNKQKVVVSPVSLIISAFGVVSDIRKTLTPQLAKTSDSVLLLIDLGQGKNRLSGSALAQVYSKMGSEPPDIQADTLKNFFTAIQSLKKSKLILAYHDRSDGGLITTLAEMMFASRLGIKINLDPIPGETLGKLFNEELGAIIQVRKKDKKTVLTKLEKAIGHFVYDIGKLQKQQNLEIWSKKKVIYSGARSELEKTWAETSYKIQSIRDNPDCATQEFNSIADDNDPGIFAKVPFKLHPKNYRKRPKVAIFREEGVNGQVEMAAAFHKAGFASIDVHLTDLISDRVNLDDFVGIVACGGFSYGDVLGAGEGWAKSILFNPKLRSDLKKFFERTDTFSLGACNGCQTLSALKDIIPGAQNWPTFQINNSQSFEARLVMTEIVDSPSIFFKGMGGTCLPIPVAHGEGRAQFEPINTLDISAESKLISMQYVDNYGSATDLYPFNPNGSVNAVASVTSIDGRATILMPHPERAFLTSQLSWHPKNWKNESPWLKMFQNAREWVEFNASGK